MEVVHLIDIKVYNAEQIGGCFTVITTSKAKIMIDYGQALPGTKAQQEDFDWEHDTVDAVFVTHYHGDHVGRILDIPSNIPIYMGKTTRQIMLNIHETLVNVPELQEEQERWVELLNSNRIKEIQENKVITDINGISITPYSVDHSAYDAYMYLIEADGKVILHTGDFRGHGYRGSKMLDVIKYYVHWNGRKVDYLITEGTMMGDGKDEEVKKESELYKDAVELFREHRYVFLVISSTNLDSLVSFYRAAKKNKMYTYCYSYYLYKQLKTFSRAAGKKSPWYQFKDVYTVDFEKQLSHELWDKNKTQEEFMGEQGFLCVIKPDEKYHDWIERFKDKNPLVIYSMWGGYIDAEIGKDAYNKKWADFFALYQKNKQFKDMHTSGHATAKMIANVIKAVDPQEAIIPMHTENASGFRELNIPYKYKKIVRINRKEMDVMDLFEKTEDDWDCRAISQKFLNEFCSGGRYHPFVELVKKHSELELCFRGNDYTNKPTTGGKVCIYRNNHAMFTITPQTLYFNPNYLRYCKDWENILEMLTNEYGFSKGKTMKLIVKREKKHSCAFSDDSIAAKLDGDVLANLQDYLEGLYQLLSKVFDNFFSTDKDLQVDRFLEWANQYDSKYAKEISPKYYESHKKIEIEKIRQQQLFSSEELQSQKSGYYFYDMEFQQKHKNKQEQEEARKNGESNKPDMQAIRFGSDGKPKALVFVEVKCTKSAYYGESGLYKHIEAMSNYPKEAFERRRREAYLILHQYEQLGLRKFDRKICPREYEGLPLEIILVFTDEAISFWKKDETPDIMILKKKDTYMEREISLPNGEKGLLVCVELDKQGENNVIV